MQVVVNIDEKWEENIVSWSDADIEDYLYKIVRNGTPLQKVMTDLQTELLMNVDGGTDDKYVRTCDVIDRIEKTIQEFMDVLDGKGG